MQLKQGLTKQIHLIVKEGVKQMDNAQTSDSKQPTKIHIAIPSRNLVGRDLCGGLAAALWKMQQDCRYEVGVKIWSGFGVDVVRNRIVAHFLNTDAEFLLMIDDDMIPPDDLLGMTAYECDIVGALYYAWETRIGPFIAAYSRNGDHYVRPVLGEIENTGLHEMALVGGGCIMLHRRVLETLPAPWFCFETDAAGQNILMPEDFHICREAGRHGLKVFLDTDRICGHIKSVDLRDVATLSTLRKQHALFDLLE